MRVAILTLGSRGDVQPYIALGKGLQQAGYNVVLVTAEQFGGFVREHGLEFAPIDRNFLGLLDTKAGQGVFEGGSRLKVMQMALPIMRQVLHDSWMGAQGSDAIIYHQKILAGYHIAEKLGIPAFMAMPFPVYPTRAFANPITSTKMPSFLNRLSYVINSGGKAPFMRMINKWRSETLGLPPRGVFATEATLPDGRPLSVLHAYSPSVVPIPEDWPPHVTVTGYWFLDTPDGWQPPAELQSFLDSGPPPVYVGFGSMTSNDPAAKVAMIIEALRLAGQRGIIASGLPDYRPDTLPGFIYLLDQAPHEWLFPRTAAVVHHGGAGTTAAGLKAGRPTVVAPFFGDQMFWGHRVLALGVGPEPIAQKRLTAEKLAQAIELATGNPEMRARAEALGHQLRAEDGVAVAVGSIGRYLAVSSPAIE